MRQIHCTARFAPLNLKSASLSDLLEQPNVPSRDREETDSETEEITFPITHYLTTMQKLYLGFLEMFL